MKTKTGIGIDIGGSHITAAIIDFSAAQLITLHSIRKEINASDTAFRIVDTIATCIKELVAMVSAIELVGIAFPGPFDYKKGVSAIANVGGKYQQTFGLHLAQALKDACGLNHSSLYFLNDAHSFALGADQLYQLKKQRAVFLTLGPGFGSAFMVHGSILNKDLSIPLSGAYID